MGLVALSPAQQIRLYGLFPSSGFLHWSIVTENKLSFKWLTTTVCLTPRQLHTLQNNVLAWVENGLVDMDDCCNMSLWPLNPLTHLGASIDCCLGASAPALKAYGITFSQMKDSGLTPSIMSLFHFTFQDWCLLGIGCHDISEMDPTHTQILFSRSPRQCLDELATPVKDGLV